MILILSQTWNNEDYLLILSQDFPQLPKGAGAGKHILTFLCKSGVYDIILQYLQTNKQVTVSPVQLLRGVNKLIKYI